MEWLSTVYGRGERRRLINEVRRGGREIEENNIWSKREAYGRRGKKEGDQRRDERRKGWVGVRG